MPDPKTSISSIKLFWVLRLLNNYYVPRGPRSLLANWGIEVSLHEAYMLWEYRQ